MKPYKIEIYIYAETDTEAVDVQKAMISFVKAKYDNGILVTAKRLLVAIERFKDNVIVNQFFK